MKIFNHKKIVRNEPTIGAGEGSRDNPYVVYEAGRKEWSDRYANMAGGLRTWQAAFGLSMLVVVALTIALIKISQESHVQPFAVEVNNGMPVAMMPMTSMNNQDDKLVLFAITQFIRNARSVVSDVDAEKKMLSSMYAFSADNTIPFLNEYFRKNSPFDRVQKSTTSVEIVNKLPISPHTWQIVWDETERDIANGHVLKKTHWLAQVTYHMGPVKPETINDNPFGLYITDLTWSQSQIALGEKN